MAALPVSNTPLNFNSRPSARGDPHGQGTRPIYSTFQFTPLREGRLRIYYCYAPRYYFNSRPSARGDVYLNSMFMHQSISIHAPPRGATWQSVPAQLRRCTFQFTPLREGRRALKIIVLLLELFQFTPLREGRRGLIRIYSATTDFNSRPSARGDESTENHRSIAGTISIHAPPRGATLKAVLKDATGQISIHAPPRGATGGILQPENGNQFQFTPLREGRHSFHRTGKNRNEFQFTPLREGRRVYQFPSFRFRISIHAPPRGATKASINSRLSDLEFQFTPLREGRQYTVTTIYKHHLFQFTPLREGRRGNFCRNGSCFYFNSRPSARGDGKAGQCAERRAQFQFTPLREGRRCPSHDDKTASLFQFTPLREGRRQKICNFCKSFVQPLQISMA